MLRKRMAVLLALAALLPACSRSSRADGPPATLDRASLTTATTANPYAVPALIDAAYVNTVLAGLDGVIGDVTRMVIQTKTIPHEGYDRLRAIYDNTEWIQLRLQNYQDDIHGGFAGYKAVPGDRRTTVVQLIAATPTCIFAKVVRDYSSVGENGATADPQWIALKPLDPKNDPGRANPTPWAYAYDGYPPDRTQPSNPCSH